MNSGYEYDSIDDWLLDVNRRGRHQPRKYGRALDAETEQPSRVPDADQGVRGQPPGADTTPSADDWLVELMNKRGSKSYD
jgi:hypothetical protein